MMNGAVDWCRVEIRKKSWVGHVFFNARKVKLEDILTIFIASAATRVQERMNLGFKMIEAD